jgi:hypothetical protein
MSGRPNNRACPNEQSGAPALAVLDVDHLARDSHRDGSGGIA